MPNFHSARIKNPKDFKKFRYAKNKLGKGIDVVWGIRDNGKTEIQAIRFSKNQFDKEQARNWMKTHKKKFLSLEGRDPDMMLCDIYTGKSIREILLSEVLNEPDVSFDTGSATPEPSEESEESEPISASTPSVEKSEEDNLEPTSEDIAMSVDAVGDIESVLDAKDDEVGIENVGPEETVGPEVPENEVTAPFELEDMLGRLPGVSMAELEEVVDAEHFYFIELDTENESVAREYDKFKLTNPNETIQKVTDLFQNFVDMGKISHFELIDAPQTIPEFPDYYTSDYVIAKAVITGGQNENIQ